MPLSCANFANTPPAATSGGVRLEGKPGTRASLLRRLPRPAGHHQAQGSLEGGLRLDLRSPIPFKATTTRLHGNRVELAHARPSTNTARLRLEVEAQFLVRRAGCP